MMKNGFRAGFIIFIISVLLIPAYFISRTFGVFQDEVVLTKYALAFEADGQKYAVWPLINSFAAMDKRGDDRQLYYQIGTSDINYLLQLAYGEFDLQPSKDNPYLAGGIQYRIHGSDYMKTVRNYENARDYTDIYQFYDAKGRIIYTYDPGASMDKAYVKEIIAAGMTRSSAGGGRGDVMDRYLNITKLFKDKLGISVKLDVDQQAKIVAISMER
ncbi:hypothetical protein [Paenibacillus apiarius]|uniref:hypothetical protein n=1 Tax=Paenibacillus apiarius TaxID=46240 RepID=UPI003B3ACD0A